MEFSTEELIKVFAKTKGSCSFCEIKLSFDNYGLKNYCAQGAWEVFDENVLSSGVDDIFLDYLPICSLCHREKGDRTTDEFKREVKGYSSPQNFHVVLRIVLRKRHCKEKLEYFFRKLSLET
jgi:hypothetical protein